MKQLFTIATKHASTILRQWSNNSHYGYFTGVTFDAGEVFSICDGVVVQSETTRNNTKVITVQYSSDTYVRYLNIVELTTGITLGGLVREGQLLGKVHKNQATIELCEAYATDRKWPVRIGTRTVYKVDPMPYLTDADAFHKHAQIRVVTDEDVANIPTAKLTSAMMGEFNGMNKGE